MRSYNIKPILSIICLIIILMTGNASATDYILDTPGSTSTNGSGTTHVSGDPANKPDIGHGLADGDTLTLTGDSGGSEGEYSIQLYNTCCIYGALGQGNNTITLDAGSRIYLEVSNTGGYAGIAVRGTTKSDSIVGIVGDNADNTVIVNGDIVVRRLNYIETYMSGIYAENNNSINVSGNIKSTRNNFYGIKTDANNSIDVSGHITSWGDNSYGSYVANNNSIDISGNITEYGDNSYGVSAANNNSIDVSGYINNSGDNSYGISVADNNSIDVSGSITNTGINAFGIKSAQGNIIVLRNNSKIIVKGTGDTAIALMGLRDGSSFGNVAYIGGLVKATGGASAALSSTNKGAYYFGSNSFYLLNGSCIQGDISNSEINGKTTSFLINGYATNNTTGKAQRTSIDSSFNFTFNDNINSISTGLWDLFAAGGKTTLNGSTNQLSRLFIGADCFDGTTVADGNDGAGNAATANLTSIAGATATLTVNNAISTLNAINGVTGSQTTTPAKVIVGSGSTYNLNGTHTHEFDNADSFNILGTMNLGTNGQILDYQNNDAVVVTLGGVANNGAGATVGGTLNSSAASQSLGIKVYNGSTSNVNVRGGDLTLTSVANNGTLNSIVNRGATLSLRSNANLNTLDLAGTLQTSSAQNLTLLRTAANTTGNVNISSNAFTLNGLANNGSVNFNVGRMGTLVNNTGGTIDLSHNKGALTLDFGTNANTSLYATTTGAFKSSGTDKLDSVYGVNGVVGTTYSNVFDTQVIDENDNTYADGTELNNNTDRYRTYILTHNGLDVSVENNNVIREDVLGLGGSEQAADAANFLVEHQGSFDASGQSFVNQLTTLSGHNLLRGSQELIGEEATAGTIQSGLQSIGAASGAVRDQLTSFRMGSLSSGLASSFSSSGSTAATSDMADAEELAEAYDAADISYTDDTSIYRKLTVWANGFGGFGEQGTMGDTTGYDFWNVGTMIGMDYAFAQELRVGGLLGYSYNKTNLYTNSGDSTDNALRLGAYSSFNWDNFFVDLSPTMGIHMIDSNRNLITNGLTAKGERTALDFNINGTMGYTFTLPAYIQFTPSYSLGYTLLHDPDYTETGAGAGNLSYGDFNSNSLLQDIGMKFGRLFRLNNKLSFLPEVWGGWEVEYLNTGGDRDSTTSTSIGGNTYSTSMSSLETYRGYWGAGLTALIKDNISVYGRYDHKIWHKGFNAGFSAGIKISF